jgi:hypothetical protein
MNMMIDLSERFVLANERRVSHEFSGREILSTRKEIEPFDYIGSIPEYFAEQKAPGQTHVEH